MSNKVIIPLQPIKFTWTKVASFEVKEGEIMVPVYLNKSRTNLVFSIKMRCGKIKRELLYQKAIALIAWN